MGNELLALGGPAELLRPLPSHTVVRLPDGSIGEVAWSDFAEVHVIHGDRTAGRGPWYFARHQVEEVLHAPTIAEYRHRCAARSLGLVVIEVAS